jgi:hypothetical protein
MSDGRIGRANVIQPPGHGSARGEHSGRRGGGADGRIPARRITNGRIGYQHKTTVGPKADVASRTPGTEEELLGCSGTNNL